MEKITLDGSLTLTFPDGFRKPEGSELAQLNALQADPGALIRNDDLHIIASLGCKRGNFLLALLNNKDLLKNTESKVAASMRSFGYRKTETGEYQLGGKKALFFRYAYEAKETPMVGECVVLKEGKTVYYLHFYVREACREEGLRLWKDILARAVWA